MEFDETGKLLILTDQILCWFKKKKKKACLTSYVSHVVMLQTFKALLFTELGSLPSSDSVISAFFKLASCLPSTVYCACR